jgi:hypothetical protein
MAGLFADFFVSFMCLILIALAAILLYKNRRLIKKFASDPDYGKEWKPSRKTILTRRIEDANAEMDYIDEQEEKQKGGD